MLCHWYFSKHLEFDKYTNRNPNNYSTIPFLDDNNDPDNATTTDNIDESASSRSDHRDIIFVVLAFLSVTGCFIYLLCKCSNSCGPEHHFDARDEQFDDDEDGNTNNNDNSMMMIEMGDFDFVDHMDPMHPLDLVSVDLTLDQELSEDERSIHRTHPSTTTE